MYPRTGGNIGSSGFEHVFLNEMKYGSPIGLHNWIYYYHKENASGTVHDVDYKGFMRTQLLGDVKSVQNRIFRIFDWNNFEFRIYFSFVERTNNQISLVIQRCYKTSEFNVHWNAA